MVSTQSPHKRIAVLSADATQQRPVSPVESWLYHILLLQNEIGSARHGLQEPVVTGIVALRLTPISADSCRLGLPWGGRGPEHLDPFGFPTALRRRPIATVNLDVALRASRTIYMR